MSWTVADGAGHLGEDVLRRWDDLAVASARPFCAPGWLLAWWEHVRPARTALRVVLVTEGGELIGVAPFYEVGRRPLLVRWHPLGGGLCDRVEPLARAGREHDVAQAVTAAAAAGGIDVVVLAGIPAGSPWPGLLRAAWPGRRRPWTGTRAMATALTIGLRERDVDAWFMARTSHFRQRLRRNRREFERRGGTVRVATPETIERDIRRFAELHRVRWSSPAAPSVVTPAVERMLVDAGRSLSAGDRLRVVSLDLDGRTIASSVVLGAGTELAYWLNVFDADFASISPSRISILTVIEQAFALGAQRLDLGAGVFEYKKRFADAEETLEWVWLVAPGRRAAAGRAAVHARWLVQDAQRRLDPEARARLRRLLGPLGRAVP